MDETTDISTKKQCGIAVIVYDDEERNTSTRFFDLVETSAGTADELTTTLLSTIIGKGIKPSQIIGFSSDTTNVMAGGKHSVFTNLRKEIPDIACIKCSCHMVNLSSSNACRMLPRSVEDVLRNIGSHFSRSASRQSSFVEFQQFFRTDIHKILSPCATRWLALKACVDRVLKQYIPLSAYFLEVSINEHSITTEEICKTLNNPFTKIYLEFMDYVLGKLTKFNLLFQSEKPLLHRLKSEFKNLLSNLCFNFLNKNYITNIDILNVVPSDTTKWVSSEKLYLGIAAGSSLNEIKKNVKKSDLDNFYLSCRKFYVELIQDLKKRFNFDDKVFNVLGVLEIESIKQFQIPSLSGVLERFPIFRSKVSEQELDSEWRELCSMNSDHEVFKNLDIQDGQSNEIFWSRIFLTKKHDGSPKYKNLSIVVKGLLVLPFSNASVERVFSELKNIKDIHRNKLNTETISAILHTKRAINRLPDPTSFEPPESMLVANVWKNITSDE